MQRDVRCRFIYWRNCLAATRVHLLATELNVKSKAIIDKCKAEGLENITNHMSTISAGLAATIREWFSDGDDHSTAVESAEKVDLEKVRVKRTRKKTEAAPKEESVEADVVVETHEHEQPVVEAAVADEMPAVEPEVVELLPEAEIFESPEIISPARSNRRNQSPLCLRGRCSQSQRLRN